MAVKPIEEKVAAIFLGHYHDQVGYSSKLEGVPYFYSSSPGYEQMLVSRFSNTYFEVYNIKTEKGIPTFLTKKTFPLNE